MYYIQLAQQNKQPFSYFHNDVFWNLHKKEPPDMIFVQPKFFRTNNLTPYACQFSPRSV
jgi:hypothetical protein